MREERGLSQEQLGAEAGLHRNTTGLIERGQHDPTVRTLRAMAGVLGTRASTILADAEVEEAKS